jgi:glycine betaine/proline transport system substrate-binding protein
MGKIKYWMCGLVIGAALVGGCSRADKANEIRLAYVNWAEGVAVTHLMEVLLSDMGYTVSKTMADVAPIYVSVADGSQDIMIETWLPVTHEAYYSQYGEQLELLGPWFEQAQLGLVVPTYVTIDRVDQLGENAEQFGNRIVGIDAGAGLMGQTENAIEAYGLDNMNLLASSGPAMTAELQSAIESEEWVVVTGWAPHWKFARYDLKFLEDTEGVFPEVEEIYAAARPGFSAEQPEVAALFNNLRFSGAEIGSLMDAMENAEGREEEAIRAWIAENLALVASWMP